MGERATGEERAKAVEDAVVVLYAVSRSFKESERCKREAQYAHQCGRNMVPLMMEDGYRCDGWLGFVLGTRLWYAFFESVLSDEAVFKDKIDELCRELGERGKGLELL